MNTANPLSWMAPGSSCMSQGMRCGGTDQLFNGAGIIFWSLICFNNSKNLGRSYRRVGCGFDDRGILLTTFVHMLWDHLHVCAASRCLPGLRSIRQDHPRRPQVLPLQDLQAPHGHLRGVLAQVCTCI